MNTTAGRLPGSHWTEYEIPLREGVSAFVMLPDGLTFHDMQRLERRLRTLVAPDPTYTGDWREDMQFASDPDGLKP